MRRFSSTELAACTVALVSVASPLGAQPRAGPDQEATGGRHAVFEFDDHPSLRLGTVARLEALAKFQIDWRRFGATTEPAGWDVHRARLGITGDLFSVVEYQIERELHGDGNGWRDAFVDVSALSALQVRAGQFKIPFSLDELTGSMDLDFVYRSLAGSALAPGRDVGSAVHGRLLSRRVRYDAGWFRRGGENVRASERSDPDSGHTFAARVTVAPWHALAKSRLRNLTIGGGLTRGHLPEGLNSVNGRTVSDEPFFRKVYVAGNRRRFGGDVEWRTGPFGVRSEMMRVVDDRRGQGTDDNDLPVARADGGYVSGTWLVTGERKSDSVRPRHPLFQGGLGAVEVAARFERLEFASSGDAAPSGGPRAASFPAQAARVVTVGVNWYLNRFVRLQVDALRERRFDGGNAVGERASWSRVLRLQFGV